MGKFKKFFTHLLSKKSAKEKARENLEEFRAKKQELELFVKTHLQMMQSFPEFENGLQSVDKISSMLIFKNLEKPLFYKLSAIYHLREMLADECIDEENVHLMFLREVSGFKAIPYNLVWVYNGYFVSVGMNSYIGYIADIERTTESYACSVSYLTLSTKLDDNVFKNVVLDFNLLTASPEKICLVINDCDDGICRSAIIKAYEERPNEQRLIKDCRYYQKYFL